MSNLVTTGVPGAPGFCGAPGPGAPQAVGGPPNPLGAPARLPLASEVLHLHCLQLDEVFRNIKGSRNAAVMRQTDTSSPHLAMEAQLKENPFDRQTWDALLAVRTPPAAAAAPAAAVASAVAGAAVAAAGAAVAVDGAAAAAAAAVAVGCCWCCCGC